MRAPLVIAALLFATVFVAGQDTEFPEGEGKKILSAACTSCHGLDYVTKLRGYYSREQWRDVVNTMVEYGTELKKDDQGVLVEYLTVNFGRR